IARDDMPELRDELGDLMLQVVFHARMAEEQGLFDFESVARAISDKMISRHPHVFAGETVASTAEQTISWESKKAEERAAKAAATGHEPSALDGVSVALPAQTRAVKLARRAARVGFDWPDILPVLAKLEEEIGELRQEIVGGAEPARMEDELGDVLFSVANLARHLDIDPETALRRTNAKFEHRFRHVEKRLRETGRSLEEATLEEMDRLWEEAKTATSPVPLPEK
ncbi:MAG: nucleoside triphosphate pyrophosphohydrolase, partial [Alphaproteobacteria bacterium]|nr:nucleoside triphosphate pyrophosphohydrolase [Alphaproteobacteria bacterium]